MPRPAQNPAATSHPIPAQRIPPGGSNNTPSTARLLDQLGTEIANCRQARMPISLLLLQIDDFESVIEGGGVAILATIQQNIRALIRNTVDLGDSVLIESISTSCLGVVLVDADRQQAAGVARQVLESIRGGAATGSSATKSVTVSMGLASLAMPPRNFPVPEMLRAAERCLNGAKLSGGNSLKSIEIC
jgi:diguanylate cyclase (GGDEF)-like protein